MKKIIAGLFAIAAFTFSAIAQDKTDHRKMNKQKHGMHKGHEGKGMEGIEKLNLTVAQREQIKSINQDFTTRLHALNQNDNILVKDMKVQRKALMEERKNRIAAILTPEQKIQFEQLRKEHGEGGERKGEWKNKTKGEDWKQKRKVEDGKEKIKTKS
jgi:Spy/CpxP family protein refolding chaperone